MLLVILLSFCSTSSTVLISSTRKYHNYQAYVFPHLSSFLDIRAVPMAYAKPFGTVKFEELSLKVPSNGLCIFICKIKFCYSVLLYVAGTVYNCKNWLFISLSSIYFPLSHQKSFYFVSAPSSFLTAMAEWVNGATAQPRSTTYHGRVRLPSLQHGICVSDKWGTKAVVSLSESRDNMVARTPPQGDKFFRFLFCKIKNI